MNRAKAYQLVIRTLEELKAESWEQLAARVGDPAEDWEAEVDGERFVLFTWAQQIGVPVEALRVHVAAGSPTCGPTQRIEESFRVANRRTG